MAKPPKAVREAARQGLSERKEQPPSKRGGTPVGIARARDLANGREVPESTLKRIVSFFARHSVDKRTKGSKARQAWLLWGGDSGRAWAKREVAKAKRGQR